MKFEIDTGKIVEDIVSEVLEREIEGKTIKQWMAEITKHKWISVKDRMPAETHSIFWPLYGRKEWNNAMWREQSDKVLVTVTFKDGTRLVTTGETHDGEWHTSVSKTLNPIVTHWMQMPEPAEEDEQ